ncbi:hypothetical protein E2C01_068211 [Portunus trituberculatus]|uniref:Uncharacterized protein n=1 Tax=Portunus trituberculatus TaxID=210409 RepID=A0A5B7HNA8_PORTR|nr:hypothetical protein [Portunus trituberculatus]
MPTALLILLTACLSPSPILAAEGFLLPLITVLSTSNARVNQYSQSLIPFTGKLWNSLPASPVPLLRKKTIPYNNQSSSQSPNHTASQSSSQSPYQSLNHPASQMKQLESSIEAGEL